MRLMSGFRRPPRDHNNERPMPPVPVIVRVDPALPEPDLTSPIAPDEESLERARFSVDEAYRLAARAWGHEFGVSWAAYVAGLSLGHRWTMRQLQAYRFLKWLHEQGRL